MSRPIMRPSGTSETNTGLTVTGAATARAALADGADADLTAGDGSYVGATGGGACTTLVPLADPTWPSGAVSKSARIRFRARALAGSTPGRCYAEWRKANGAVICAFDYRQFGSSFATQGGAWNAVTLSQADVNASLLFVHTNKSAAGPYQVLCAAAALDLILAEVPTAAITTATTSYTSSSILTEWSHTPGTDGDVQAYYRVMWLSAAQQATVTGGDPTTSTSGSLYDSGVVASTAASLTVDNLPAGTLTRYVRTAQAVNGQPQWSAWVSQSVTVTLTTAEVLAVTPTVDSANGRISVYATRDTAKDPWNSVDVEVISGTDVLAGIGKMEGTAVGGVVGGWSGWAFGAITGVTWSAPTVSGRGQVQRIAGTTTGTGTAWITPTTTARVNPGDVVEVVAWANSSAWGNNYPWVGVEWFDANGVSKGVDWSGIAAATGWTARTRTHVAPAGVSLVRPIVGIAGVGAGSAFTVDLNDCFVFINQSWTPLTEPTPATNDITVYDYVTPPNVTAIYRARAVKTGPVAGSWVYSADTIWTYATGSTDACWLKVPDKPWLNMRPWVVDRPLENSRTRRTNTFAVLDDSTTRTARTITASSRLGGRVTSLVVWTETAAQAAQLEAIAREGVAIIHPPADWRFTPGTFTLGDLEEDVSGDIPTSEPYQLWRIGLVEQVD